MFLTAFVMARPAAVYDDGISPVANQIGVEEALQKASVPLPLHAEERSKGSEAVRRPVRRAAAATPEDLSLRILVRLS